MTVQRHAVPDGLYREIDRRVGGIKRKLNQRGGSPLDPEAVAWGFQMISEGRFSDLGYAATPPTPMKVPTGRFPELVLAPEQLIKNCRTWNETYQWGFSAGDFQNLPDPPSVPDEPFCTLVLTPHPPDTEGRTGLQRGFDGLWDATKSHQPDAWRWDNLLSNPGHLQLLEGVTYEPGLVWEVIDLGANWDRTDGVAPHTVRDPKTSPHLGVLAAAAHHPHYVPTMDGSTRPFLWLPGFRVTVPGHVLLWRRVPCLGWGVVGRAVGLFTGRDDFRRARYAVPARRER